MDADGPMQKTRKLLVEQGAWFDNAFVATPICCPSRAEIQTGRYMHNVGVPNNQCGGREFIDGAERHNVAHFMAKGGYKNFYAGKYLNNYGTNHHGATNRKVQSKITQACQTQILEVRGSRTARSAVPPITAAATARRRIGAATVTFARPSHRRTRSTVAARPMRRRMSTRPSGSGPSTTSASGRT